MEGNYPFDFERIAKESNEALLKMFIPKIKANFLKKVFYKIRDMNLDYFRYFDMGMSAESLASGVSDSTPNYELCRNIVAIHRFNCIGLTDNERTKNEASDEYCKHLIGQVMEQIRIRSYAGAFFRNNRVTSEEDYIFFPPAYKLFAICQRGRQILLNYEGKDIMFIDAIFNKILPALILVENGFLESAYPSARAAIEIYLRWLVLCAAPEANEKFTHLANIQLQKYCNDGQNPEELGEEFNSGSKYRGSILSYMNFGWVDDIQDYDTYVAQKHYSIDGLITYLEKKWAAEESQTEEEERLYKLHFDLLKILYNRCHAYTHGNISPSKYSLLEFTDLTIMLSMVGRHVYATLTDKAGISPNIVIKDREVNENILVSFDRDRHKLHWIHDHKSDELFMTFHGYKK